MGKHRKNKMQVIDATIRFKIHKLTERKGNRIVPHSYPPYSEEISVFDVEMIPIASAKIKNADGSDIDVSHVPSGRIKLNGLAKADGFNLTIDDQFDVRFYQVAPNA